MPFKDKLKKKEYDKVKKTNQKEKKETFKCRPFEEVAIEFEKTPRFNKKTNWLCSRR